MNDLHNYKVGIMSSVALVEAPSPLAAAVYFGIQTDGNAQLGAVVYEVDGERYEGEQQNLRWLFGSASPTKAELATLTEELKRCRFVNEAEPIEATLGADSKMEAMV